MENFFSRRLGYVSLRKVELEAPPRKTLLAVHLDKPIIKTGFPKNLTAAVNHTASFECPLVDEVQHSIIWIKVDEHDPSEEIAPKGVLIKVSPMNFPVDFLLKQTYLLSYSVGV